MKRTGATEGGATGSNEALLQLFDSVSLNRRYWVAIGLLSLILAVDFFDFFIVGFLVAVLAPKWGLTFGQSSIILLSAGVGAIVGALFWGSVADAYGRKKSLICGTMLCAVCSGSVALLADGNWIGLAALRFGVGVGLAGVATPTLALIVEYTPTRYRTILPGLTTLFATFGTLLASATAATLLSVLGWRGVAALGLAPVLLGILAILWVPESVRWLVARNRFDEARAAVARLLSVPLSSVPTPRAEQRIEQPARFIDLYREPRRFWLTVIVWIGASAANYGVYLWGPTIVAVLLEVSAQDAAGYFVYVALAGIAGKVVFSFLPQWLGRKVTGQIGGFGIAAALAAAALLSGQFYAGIPLFIALLIVGAIFYDGLFANISPYAAELFPVKLAARGVGLAQAANGVGKIVGPLTLALIAGADNFIAPKATADAVLPAFLFLAGCGLAIGLAFTLIPIETHQRPLEQQL